MLNRDDVKACLYVLNYEPVMYHLPIAAPANIDGCFDRLIVQLENYQQPKDACWANDLCNRAKDWYSRNENLAFIKRATKDTSAAQWPYYQNKINSETAELEEATKKLARMLFSSYTKSGHCYRKTLTVDGTTYDLSPVTKEEFRMFHGGDIEFFKKDFYYKELTDFTPEQLARAKISVYDGDGMELQWSSWNCCMSFEETDEKISL